MPIVNSIQLIDLCLWYRTYFIESAWCLHGYFSTYALSESLKCRFVASSKFAIRYDNKIMNAFQFEIFLNLYWILCFVVDVYFWGITILIPSQTRCCFELNLWIRYRFDISQPVGFLFILSYFSDMIRMCNLGVRSSSPLSPF